MRALVLAILCCACDADPHIACKTDSECLSGETCSAGACSTPSSSPLVDAGPGSGTADAPPGDGAMPAGDAATDAPGSACTPACVTPMCCVAGTCQLLGC
jgi:hypothetical protein